MNHRCLIYYFNHESERYSNYGQTNRIMYQVWD
jgi:hypothetical protein